MRECPVVKVIAYTDGHGENPNGKVSHRNVVGDPGLVPFKEVHS